MDRKKDGKKKFLAAGALLLLSLLLQVLARNTEGFAEWYAVRIYPVLMEGMGRVCSLFPFSVIEVLIGGGILLAAVLLFRAIRKVTRKEKRVRDFFRSLFRIFFVTGSVLFFVFTINCGINYHRKPFSELAGFSVEPSSVEELTRLCLLLTEEINETAPLIQTDEQGLCTMDESAMRAEARNAMRALGVRYPELSGYYPLPKPVFFSEVLSLQRTEGVYSAYTMEANYNRKIPDYDLPATMCHELSHLKGFMREDEANFIAYLACQESESPEFRYSGSMLAYVYSMNALYEADPETYIEIRSMLCDQGNRDMAAHSAYWEPYRGAVAQISQKMNDAYLKANAQDDGVKSYGRMVDLLIGLLIQNG